MPEPSPAGRVLLASTLYYPNVGGVENSIANVGEALRQLGYASWLLTSTGGDPHAPRRLFSAGRIRGLPVFRYRFSSLAPVRLVRAWRGMRLLLGRFRIDSLILRDQHSTVAAVLLGRRCVYLVPGIHSVQHKPRAFDALRWLNYKASSRLQRIALRRASRVAVFSDAMGQAVWRESGRKDVVRVRPGVDASRFAVPTLDRRQESRARIGIPPTATVCVGVGRFAGLKRFDLAIDALRHLPDDWHLVLVGSGPEEDALRRMASGLRLGPRVHFTGQVSDPERFLQLADVYVMSSESETFGQVLVEAMACGLPVAAFDSALPDVETATDEVVPGEWLFTASAKQPESLADAMVAAVEAQCDREQLAGWTHEAYSWKALARELVCLGRGDRPLTEGSARPRAAHVSA